MAAPIALRSDFDGLSLRRLARSSNDADQTRRLLALATIYDGRSRSDASRVGGVTLQIVRDWVLRFNANGPEGLITRKAPGRQSALNDVQRRALAERVMEGPIPSVHGVVRWRLTDLAQWLHEEFGVSVHFGTVSRELRAMGFRKLSARPQHHAQSEEALADFKKTSRPASRPSKGTSRRERR